MDDVCATVAPVMDVGRVLFCSGFVHGRGVTETAPAFAQEAAVLHALRVLREWTAPLTQEGIQFINIRAGGALANYQIREWMRSGRCTLASAAAPGIIKDIQNLSSWLRVNTSLAPFRIPECCDEVRRENMTWSQEVFLRVAEHFRAAVLPSQTVEWRANLPWIPMTMEEIKTTVGERHREDELKALQYLADSGSEAADIITQLDLTRELVQEAMDELRDERTAQVNLASILTATRFKTLTKSGVVPTKCPKKLCFSRDSFWHMLECYQLGPSLRRGVEAVPFLVLVERTTLLRERVNPIPYPITA